MSQSSLSTATLLPSEAETLRENRERAVASSSEREPVALSSRARERLRWLNQVLESPGDPTNPATAASPEPAPSFNPLDS